MLYHIVKPKDDSEFAQIIEAIKQLYFPQEELQQQLDGYIKTNPNCLQIPEGVSLNDIDKLLKPSQDTLQKIIKSVASYQIYKIRNVDVHGAQFPFLDRFYTFFLKRYWNRPEEKAKISVIDGQSNLVRLYPPSYELARFNDEQLDVKYQGCPNFSQNYKDYNHFINVIAAMARLINFFSDPENVRELFCCGIDENSCDSEKLNDFSKKLAYADEEEFPNMRTFKLMLACFYHDIGKTVIDARHGIEGSVILGFHTSKACQQIKTIVKEYNPQYEFERDDLLFIAELIKFHDIYGTLSTGEDSYLQLVEFLDIMKRHSLNSNNKQDQIKWGQRNVFDLWLLNVADIMVSLDEKFKLQNGKDGPQNTKNINWMDYQESQKRIKNFFGFSDPDIQENLDLKEKGYLLIHDLKISLELLEKHNQKTHTDDTEDLRQHALNYAKRHAVERVRRIIKSSLRKPLKEYILPEKIQAIQEEIQKEQPTISIGNLEEKKQKICAILNDIVNRKDANWNATIVSAIKATGDLQLQQFCYKLALIGKMDYSLGFFGKIASGALKNIVKSILQDKSCPGWFIDRNIEDYMDDQEYLYHIQAQFIADNYIAIIVQIIGYLISRDSSSEYFKNLEFRDASERLTEEKIEKIIDLEGPFRSKKSAQLILQTISMF